jgi:glycosyltransferase involved in cell wall biosynthesis
MTADAVGGVWTYALDLARGLGEAGVRVTVATMGPLPTAAQLEAAAAIPQVDVVSADWRLEWMNDPWRDVHSAGEWLLDIERRVAPDVVHLNGYAHGALPFTAPVVVAGHSCVLSWADAVPDAIDPMKLAAYRDHVTRGIRAADVVLSPSGEMLAALERHYGPLACTMVVPNGRRVDLFRPGHKEPFVFTAGRLWDPAKNVQALSRIAPRLAWPMFVAGADTLGTPAAAATTAGMHPLGTLDESALAGWLARASIFALPARYEPFGLLALEAALSGCALVLGDIPSQREVWGDAAEFVPPDDDAAIARGIEQLIASSERLAARADAARARAARYSIASMTAGYLRAYHTALGRAAARGAFTCAS